MSVYQYISISVYQRISVSVNQYCINPARSPRTVIPTARPMQPHEDHGNISRSNADRSPLASSNVASWEIPELNGCFDAKTIYTVYTSINSGLATATFDYWRIFKDHVEQNA